MNFETFLKKLPMRMARTECRFNLAVYVHPRGNDFLIALSDGRKFARRRDGMVKVPHRNRRYTLKRLEEVLSRAEQFAES